MERGCGVLVREYDQERDFASVEDLERRCELGAFSMYLVGDLVARVRHYPAFHMLVAETDDERREIVGTIRGGIKTIVHGIDLPNASEQADVPIPSSKYVRTGFISGLRVAPSHRRKGIAVKLVEKLEEWFNQNEAEYAYMAAEHDNYPSIELFTTKHGYSRFRNFRVAINPVFAHRLTPSPDVNVIQISQDDAVALYRHHFTATEFFPEDIESLLGNKLSLGTFLAVPSGTGSWRGSDEFIARPPESWAMVSSWNVKDVYRLALRNGSALIRALAKATRLLDQSMPFLRIPSIPDLFNPFGFMFLYGVVAAGPRALEMVEATGVKAHNIAMDIDCQLVVTELASCELVRSKISGWRDFSTQLCLKRIGENSDRARRDWTASPPSPSFFFDPRDT